MKKLFEKKFEILFWILVVVMWISLYWKQCVIDNLNDFYCHNLFAKLIVEGKLILVYPVYHIFVGLLAKVAGVLETEASVVVLTFAQVLSILVVAQILKVLSDIWENNMELLLTSFMLNVVQPIFFYNYKPGPSSGNGLFSPTMTFVKPFALLTVLLFYKMYKSKEYTLKNLICFFASLLLTCVIKPMFTMAFIPAAGILLLLETIKEIKSGKESIQNNLCGFIIKILPLFIIGVILIAQFAFTAFYDVPTDVLPEGVNLSSDKESHIRIGYMRSWKLAVDNVYISILFAYLFPLIVWGIILYYQNRKSIVVKECSGERLVPFRNITISYGIISFLYMAFLYQEGREIDMNFRNAWVVTFNLAFIFAYVYLRELRKIVQEKNRKSNIIFAMSYVSFAIHMFFGIALITKYILG